MEEIIKKYEAKLDYLNSAIENNRKTLSTEELEILNDTRVIMTEVLTDFRAIKSLLKTNP